MGKAWYKVWGWFEAPYTVRLQAPWERGTWIVEVLRAGEFPYHEVDFRQYDDWDVDKKTIDGKDYYFIKNPADIPWPQWHPADLF